MYKLIKEYPGSPNRGTTVAHTWAGRPASLYPEFWEKEVEKDYEILSFINEERKCIKRLNNKTNLFEWAFTSDSTLEQMLKTDLSIHSVKRLSDGEVFTIGNKIKNHNKKLKTIISFNISPNGNMSVYYKEGSSFITSISHLKEDYKILYCMHSEKGTIASIESVRSRFSNRDNYNIYSVRRMHDGKTFKLGDYISTDAGRTASIKRIQEVGTNLYIYGEGVGSPTTIMQIKHAKRGPLLTTEDGYDIPYGYDSILFYVNFSYSQSVNTCDAGSDMAKNKSTILFYTRDAAEEYIENERKQYSKNDLRRMLDL